MSRSSRSSNVQPFSVREFFERFPTEDACLEHLMELRYGLRHPCDKCLHLSTFHRLADRPAYTCAHCGANVHPMAGTMRGFNSDRAYSSSFLMIVRLFNALRSARYSGLLVISRIERAA